MAHPFMSDNIWFDRWRVEDAEKAFYEKKYSGDSTALQPTSAIAAEIAKARSHIRNSLNNDQTQQTQAAPGGKLETRVQQLENETRQLRELVRRLEARLEKVEGGKTSTVSPVVPEKPVDKPAAAKPADDDDDDFDLFDDDDDDEEAERIKAERVQAYKEKKAKKPALIAKSNIILDVKPWDDETDMKELEAKVRSVQLDGLLWGASKLVPLAYGIKKLQISCVVEDDKVGTDDLEERIVEFEDYVQSVDVAAFNKV